MNAFSLANQTPMITFLWCPMQQSGIPAERYRDGATIIEINGQRIFSNRNILCPRCSYFSR